METEFLIKLLEKGVVEFLFVGIIMYIGFKVIPYLMQKFEQQSTEHKKQIEEQTREFTLTIRKQAEENTKATAKVVDTFQQNFNTNNQWHKEHKESLDEIKLLMKNK